MTEMEEMREALKVFRSELLSCLADIQCQISALEMAAVEGEATTTERLEQLREKRQ